jgi:hypothetical protein
MPRHRSGSRVAGMNGHRHDSLRSLLATAAMMALSALVGTGCSLPTDAAPATLPIDDDFSGDCTWPTGDNSHLSLACTGGVYRLTAKVPGRHAYHATLDYRLGASTVRAEVDAREIGEADSAGRGTVMGIGCLTDVNHGYLAAVGTDGSWGIARVNHDLTWIAGTDNPGALAEVSSTRVGIDCTTKRGRPAIISLLVNGRRVSSVADDHAYAPFNDFMLWSSSYPGRIEFDWFAARRPSQRDQQSARQAASAALTLIQDDFSDPASGWPISHDANGSAGFWHGQYRVLSERRPSRWIDRPLPAPTAAITVATTAWQAAGSARSAYGVTCSTTTGLGYGFQVSPSGGYEIFASRDSGTVDLISGVMTLTDRDRPLRIAGSCLHAAAQTTLVLAVNGTEVAKVIDPAGGVGPYTKAGLLSNSTPGNDVRFDDYTAVALLRGQAAAQRASPEPESDPTVPAGPQMPVPHTAGTLFADDFSENLGVWQLHGGAFSNVTLRSGSLRIEVKDANGLEQPMTPLTGPSPAVVLDADLSEQMPPYGAGIGCQSDNGVEFHFLIRSATRRYAIWADDGSSGEEIAGGASRHIHTSGPNHLRAVCGSGGATMSLRVNGHMLASVEGGLSAGPYTDIELWVEAGRKRTDVWFDNLTARRATPSDEAP